MHIVTHHIFHIVTSTSFRHIRARAMKGTTRGIDLLEAVMTTIKRLGLSLSKLSGITTDGPPSMVGRQQGLANLLQLEASKVGNDTVMQFHFIIHQENLCFVPSH